MNIIFYVEPEMKGTKMRERYGFLNFLFDCFMIFITAGFWIIWIFVREMRKR